MSAAAGLRRNTRVFRALEREALAHVQVSRIHPTAKPTTRASISMSAKICTMAQESGLFAGGPTDNGLH